MGRKTYIEGLVSTIIPVFNRASMMKEAAASVLAQTYRPIEIIIVDDGSSDDTIHHAKALEKEFPDTIRVVSQSNCGPGPAREYGRQLVRGSFIQYLDSDDLLMPRKFELQVAGLNSHLDCGVSYGKTRMYRVGCKPIDIADRRTGERLDRMFPAFLVSRVWNTITPLYRSHICDQAGAWTDLWQEEDWEYDCRIAALGTRLHFCDEFIADQRHHSGKRLCDAWLHDKNALRDRVRAHQLIYGHARKGGIDHTSPEMQHFARGLFLLSRQCGAAGLANESRDLFALARTASGSIRGNGWDFRLYASLARVFGWTKIGKVACFADRFRHK